MKSQNAKSQEGETCVKKEEKLMKKRLAVLVLIIVVMSLYSIAQAFDGRPPHKSLNQLPGDKEMLFHQAMREVREATTSIHEQIKGVETEIRGVLTAPEFNEVLFLERTRRLQDLHKMLSEAMDKAVAKLARQFTAEERKILAEMISCKPGLPLGPGSPPTPPGPPPGPGRWNR
jgi:uncharacterized membrane protein